MFRKNFFWRRAGAGLLLALPLGCGAAPAHPVPAVVEPHHRLDPPTAVALTLDACGGGYDQRLVALLVQLRVPATLFVTRRWLLRHAEAVQELLRHPELFEFENHGAQHVPAAVGSPRTGARLYGMKLQAGEDGVRAEVSGGAAAVRAVAGHEPVFYRGAGAAYDAAGMHAVQSLGYRIAGFSVNADAGSTLPAEHVAQRLRGVRPGDVVLAHMNHPAGGTAEGFARALPELLRRGLVFVKLSQRQLVAQ